MDHMNPRNSKGQVERLARAYHRRYFASCGSSLPVEDLTQEFWLVWHNVSVRFDPDRGFAFSAMLGVSIRNKAIELAKFHTRRANIIAGSLNTSAPGSETEMINLVESDEPSGEEVVLSKERTAGLLSMVDDRLRRMIELLENTPEILEEEVKAAKAKAEFARSIGIKLTAPKEVTLTMLTDLFGLSRCSRYRLIDQMKEVMAQYD